MEVNRQPMKSAADVAQALSSVPRVRTARAGVVEWRKHLPRAASFRRLEVSAKEECNWRCVSPELKRAGRSAFLHSLLYQSEVILSAAGTSRSEDPAESKDPFPSQQVPRPIDTSDADIIEAVMVSALSPCPDPKPGLPIPEAPPLTRPPPQPPLVDSWRVSFHLSRQSRSLLSEISRSDASSHTVHPVWEKECQLTDFITLPCMVGRRPAAPTLFILDNKQ